MLALYSGGSWKKNEQVTSHLLALIGKRIRITYIPSCSSPLNHHIYKFFNKSFRSRGVSRFYYFPIDQRFSKRDLIDATNSDVVFLGCGNTFFFAQNLINFGVYPYLMKAAKQRVLSGMSAGSIIASSTLETAGIGPVIDDAPKTLHSLPALKAVDAMLLPHFSRSSAVEERLRKLTRVRKKPLFALPKGSGLFIERGLTSVLGAAELWQDGKHIELPGGLAL